MFEEYLKKTRSYLKCAWSKFSRFNRGSKKLLLIPSYMTLFVVMVAFFLAISKDFGKLSLNEIGDFFAGFAGVLAFMWIIVTVLLQNRDLNLQYEEIKDMRAASESQARSLLSAEVFKALEYVNQQFAQKASYIEERRDIIDEEIKGFMVQFPSDRSPETPFKARLDISEVWGYFKKKSVDGLYLDLDDLKADFDYEAYLKLQTINSQIDLALSSVESMVVNISPEIETQVWENIFATEKQLMIEWYREFFPVLKHLEFSVRQAIVKYEIGNEFNRQFIAASLKEEELDKTSKQSCDASTATV
ncbi:hypothetical protein [Onishia niordana]|uniref:hypothetical protein n=1 Tax=Onishia niordana TaxID=2508711 RepID=UPI00109FE2E2|nr:hypothetical protein [Halomonas niordiana]